MDVKLVAEAVLVMIALALIVWYVITNYQGIVNAFKSWLEQIKWLIGLIG
ncbi:MAG: hypothetical protein QMD36_01290 [Candidatus Aenigmarchaeota archaeon]|nr:hypothetical protein [Candidatus Aenigmarchaeota archaeon]